MSKKCSQKSRVNVRASDNSVAAYHLQMCQRCGRHIEERRALLQRDLQVWGTLGLVALLGFCAYVWQLMMASPPGDEQRYVLAYSVLQTVTLALAAMVLWAWGERALAARYRASSVHS